MDQWQKFPYQNSASSNSLPRENSFKQPIVKSGTQVSQNEFIYESSTFNYMMNPQQIPEVNQQQAKQNIYQPGFFQDMSNKLSPQQQSPQNFQAQVPQSNFNLQEIPIQASPQQQYYNQNYQQFQQSQAIQQQNPQNSNQLNYQNMENPNRARHALSVNEIPYQQPQQFGFITQQDMQQQNLLGNSIENIEQLSLSQQQQRKKTVPNFYPQIQFDLNPQQQLQPQVPNLVKKSQERLSQSQNEKLQLNQQQDQHYQNSRQNIVTIAANSPDPQFKIKVSELTRNYDAFRFINEDGNTFYKAVGLSYLEHLIRRTTPIEELYQFKNSLISKWQLFNNQLHFLIKNNKWTFQQIRKEFIDYLDKLAQLKLQNQQVELFKRLEQETSINQNNIGDIVAFALKIINANYWFDDFQSRKLQLQEQQIKDKINNEILKNGLEPQIDSILSLAEAMEIVIRIEDLTIQNQIASKQITTKLKIHKLPAIYIMFHQGRFGILYAREMSQIDGFIALECDFNPNIAFIPQSLIQNSKQEPLYLSEKMLEQNVNIQRENQDIQIQQLQLQVLSLRSQLEQQKQQNSYVKQNPNINDDLELQLGQYFPTLTHLLELFFIRTKQLYKQIVALKNPQELQKNAQLFYNKDLQFRQKLYQSLQDLKSIKISNQNITQFSKSTFSNKFNKLQSFLNQNTSEGLHLNPNFQKQSPQNNQCSNCKNTQSSELVKLDCSHVFCKRCLQDQIQQVTQGFVLLLPNEKGWNELKCTVCKRDLNEKMYNQIWDDQLLQFFEMQRNYRQEQQQSLQPEWGFANQYLAKEKPQEQQQPSQPQNRKQHCSSQNCQFQNKYGNIDENLSLILECGHNYHYNCSLDLLLRQDKSCFICQKSIQQRDLLIIQDIYQQIKQQPIIQKPGQQEQKQNIMNIQWADPNSSKFKCLTSGCLGPSQDFYTLINCNHKFHKQCLWDYLTENDMNLFKCFNSQCQELFSNEDKLQLADLIYYNENESIQKQKSMQEEQDQKVALQFQEEEEKKKQLQKKTYDCQICLGNFEMSALKTLNCDHRMCSTCLTELIKQYINEGKYKEDDLICPFVENNKLCGWPLEKGIEGNSDYGIIRWAIDEQYWDKLCNYRMNQLPGFIRCPNSSCYGRFEVPKQAITVDCVACQVHFCSLCFEQPHQGNCQDNSIQKAREAVRSAGMDVRKCPYCGFFASKDKGCEHVVCIQCKKDWTFCCEQKRNPIIQHGNHYHAQGCWCGDDYKGEDKIEKDCEECKALGKICPRPGQINPDLIEFNKLAEEERNKRDAAQ